MIISLQVKQIHWGFSAVTSHSFPSSIPPCMDTVAHSALRNGTREFGLYTSLVRRLLGRRIELVLPHNCALQTNSQFTTTITKWLATFTVTRLLQDTPSSSIPGFRVNVSSFQSYGNRRPAAETTPSPTDGKQVQFCWIWVFIRTQIKFMRRLKLGQPPGSLANPDAL